MTFAQIRKARQSHRTPHIRPDSCGVRIRKSTAARRANGRVLLREGVFAWKYEWSLGYKPMAHLGASELARLPNRCRPMHQESRGPSVSICVLAMRRNPLSNGPPTKSFSREWERVSERARERRERLSSD